MSVLWPFLSPFPISRTLLRSECSAKPSDTYCNRCLEFFERKRIVDDQIEFQILNIVKINQELEQLAAFKSVAHHYRDFLDYI